MVVASLYLQRTYKAAQTIAVHKTYSKRHDPGLRREAGQGNTPEAMAKYNRKRAAREVAWTMHQNFRGGVDAHVVFTYPRDRRPPPERAKKEFAAAIAHIRKAMKKGSEEFKWMRALGIGERGGIHMHLATNCTNLKLLQEAWPHGGVHVEPLFSTGDFSGLAKYFVDQEKTYGANGKSAGGGVKIVGRWSCSRNLVRRPPEVEEIGAFRWREPPRPRKGYVIDVDSIDAGENPFTGIPYLFYRMVAIAPPKIPKSARGEKLEEHIRRAQETIREMQRKNREDVKRAWTQKCHGKRLPAPKQGGNPHKTDDTGGAKKGDGATPGAGKADRRPAGDAGPRR